MSKHTAKIDEAALPQNLNEQEVKNARHAATFPPNTPHSLIDQFAAAEEKVLPADPRDAPRVEDPLTKVGVVEPKETKAAKTKRVAAEKKEAAKEAKDEKAAEKKEAAAVK